MKELSFERMEDIEGGSTVGCIASAVGYVAGIAAFATATGGLGLIAIGWAASIVGVIDSCPEVF